MKCLLASRFNAANIGDSVIAHKLYDILSEDFEVVRYDYLQDTFLIRDIDTVFSSTQDRMLKLINKFPSFVYNFLNFLRRRINDKLRDKKFEDLTEKITDFDLIVVGGGNMVMTLSNKNDSINKFSRYINMSIEKKYLCSLWILVLVRFTTRINC